jgi:MFS family permease
VTVFRRYGELLRLPGALPPVLFVLVGRLSFGMTGLSVLLLVEERTGSYARAGAAAAVYAVTLAIASPLRSRTIDREGQTRVLRLTGTLHPLAITAFLVALLSDAPQPAYLGALIVAGIFVPPLGSVMRTLWGDITPDDTLRARAYAMEGVLIELAFVLGPLLVGLIVAVAGPAPAVAFAGTAAAVGGLGLSFTGASRRWRPDTAARTHRFLGPLVSPGVRVVLLAFLCTGASFGAVEVAVPAMSEDAGHRAAVGGLLLSVWALGSAAGGLIYGSRDWSMTADRLYVRLLGLIAVGAVLPLLAPTIEVLAGMLFLYGLAIAPSGACATLLMSRHAPPGTVTEAFGWTTTAIFVGASVGNALTGLVVESATPRLGLVITLVLGLAAYAVGVLGRGRLELSPAV